MTFLHNETSWTIMRLSYVWDKWTYASTWNIYYWHKKPVSITDKTFNISNTIESAYKWTIRRNITEWMADIKTSDKIDIWWVIYIVKAVKFYEWLNFATTKVLLTK